VTIKKIPANAVEEIRKIMETQIVEWVSQSRHLDSVVKLPGDASSRKYYRVTFRPDLAAQGGPSTCIVMKMEPFADQGMDLPFLVVRDHLDHCGVRVPGVFDVDPARGMVLLEDLGDVTLLRRLQECSNAEDERHYYERVIDDLVRMQVNAGPAQAPRALDAFTLRFDVEKLMWEVHFTIEHFYEQYLKRVIRPEDRQVLETSFAEICERLAAQPLVLTHRDFHSRNVMVAPTPGSTDLVMIDFQDARMGPAQYDLASLLKDSYYQLEESQIQRLIDYYVARYEALSGARIQRTQFQEVFDLMAVQRNFKAIGSFASFLNRRGDATYLKYIGNTFENIRRTLLKYPRYSELREVLFHYYYF